MKHRTSLALVTAIAIVLTASTPSAASAASAGHSRPITATTDSPYEVVDFCDIAGVPGALTTTGGTSNVVHLGKTTYSGTVCVVFTNPTTLSGYSRGEIVWIAANGDRLFSSMTGTFGPANIDGTTPIHYTMAFDGGSGRFVDATGGMTSDGLLVSTGPTTGHHTATWFGLIDY
jgi:hypothetical protein